MKTIQLLTPGPTPVPPQVSQVMAQPILHHRSVEFYKVLSEVMDGLHWLLGNESDVLVFACSGTGAMESAVANLLSPGDTAITVNAGNFGARWGQIIRSYDAIPIEITGSWGDVVSPAMVLSAVHSHPEASVVYLQATETSTGVSHPVREIAKILADTGVLVVVDGITAVGVDDIQQERDKIDVLITGSQKALMLPPGLACVGIRERAWSAINSTKSPRYYFDWRAERLTQSRNKTRFTPAISLIVGLREVLAMFRKEGLDSLWKRHITLANYVRSYIMNDLGLDLFAKSSPSNAVTAVCMPEGYDVSVFLKNLYNKYGIKLAGGQGKIRNKIFRIGHLGHINKADIDVALPAIKDCLWNI